jgi:two-component system cell cycle response regulator CtrA
VDVDARIEVLEELVETQREEIERLKALLGVTFLAPVEWELTGSEGRMFGVLMARDLATKLQLHEAVGGGRIDGGPQAKIVDGFICKMRRKLAPFGISIETRWAEGYFLTPGVKARARELIAVSISAERVAA